MPEHSPNEAKVAKDTSLAFLRVTSGVAYVERVKHSHEERVERCTGKNKGKLRNRDLRQLGIYANNSLKKPPHPEHVSSPSV